MLKRIAAETPGEFGKALDTLIEKLQEQVDNLTTMKENLGGLGGASTHVEGDPAPAQPVPGAPETISAGLQETATEHPEMIEEAFKEFYLGLDEILSMTENFADALDIPLPDAVPRLIQYSLFPDRRFKPRLTTKKTPGGNKHRNRLTCWQDTNQSIRHPFTDTK